MNNEQEHSMPIIELSQVNHPSADYDNPIWINTERVEFVVRNSRIEGTYLVTMASDGVSDDPWLLVREHPHDWNDCAVYPCSACAQLHSQPVDNQS